MTAAVLLVLAAALCVAVLVHLADRRRAELDAWHAAEVERAADRAGLDPHLVATLAADRGMHPDYVAAVLVETAVLRRVFAIGAAANRLPPALRNAADRHG